MINDFNFYAPTRVVFGRESEGKIGELVTANGGSKVLIHYGGGRNGTISGFVTLNEDDCTKIYKAMIAMAKDAIVFACANPTPEIFPDEAKAGGAAVVSTGRSDYPNQINNVLAFPGIFRGAFDVRASDINEEMKMAAAEALAGLIAPEELSADYIIPKAFDPRVGPAVAKAVAEAARRTGVARI